MARCLRRETIFVATGTRHIDRHPAATRSGSAECSRRSTAGRTIGHVSSVIATYPAIAARYVSRPFQIRSCPRTIKIDDSNAGSIRRAFPLPCSPSRANVSMDRIRHDVLNWTGRTNENARSGQGIRSVNSRCLVTIYIYGCARGKPVHTRASPATGSRIHATFYKKERNFLVFIFF